jgi:hypothetical protein
VVAAVEEILARVVLAVHLSVVQVEDFLVWAHLHQRILHLAVALADTRTAVLDAMVAQAVLVSSTSGSRCNHGSLRLA